MCRLRSTALVLFLLLAPAPVFAAGGAAADEPAAEGHGAPAESAADGGDDAPAASAGHGEEAAAPAAPAWKLGKPLEGHFDLALLRNRERVTSFRYDMEGISHTVPRPDRPRELTMSIVLEFGRESGMAEIQELDPILRYDIMQILSRFSFRDLMHADGKRRLKEQIKAEVNRRLRTASVRNVYFTQFEIYVKPVRSPLT